MHNLKLRLLSATLAVMGAAFIGGALSTEVLASDEQKNNSADLSMPVRIATLKSVSFEGSNVVFSVKSHGCSNKEDFRLLVDGPELIVLRLKTDLCRRMPEWKMFTLPLNDPELKDWDELYIGNPLDWRS